MLLVPIRPYLAACFLLAILALPFVTGCKGCRTSPIVQRKTKAPDIDELEKKKKDKEKPKEDFEFQPPRVLPDEPGEMRAFVKPGHWITVRNFVKANNFDFQAELHTRSTDSTGRLLRVENTEFQMESTRPAPLPKGQEKLFDSTYFIPFVNTVAVDPLQPRSVWLARELRAARGGRLVKEDTRQATVPIPSYQYYMVVLASEPDRFSFLKQQFSVQAPSVSQSDTKILYYRVYIPPIERVAPLPGHSLTWTSIAYLIWDDVPPVVMTTAQQQALLDWLHWGGQLVISGPTTLEKLRGSFLDPYLPAKPGRSVEAPAGSIDEINQYWSLTSVKGKNPLDNLASSPDKPLIVAELERHEEAQYVPHCGELVVERQLGNGRIVATAMSLADARLLRWRNIDNFLNGAILRRPRRDFRTVDSMPDTVWHDYEPSLVTDARLATTLRYFSRDAGHFAADVEENRQWEPGEEPKQDPLPEPRFAVVADPQPPAPRLPPATPAGDPHFRGFPFRQNTGMAAWNDRSGPSDAAREALKDAAGISIPKADFVLKVLAIYLAVLAPLNWLVFRAIGRVEWAWVAAPGIAVLGTFAVVRLAQLDIGFARSTTEIGIAEMHAGFPRAHITRYTALYTSLSTNYELQFDDPGSLAQPFPTATATVSSAAIRPNLQTVTLRHDKNVTLSGFLVPSNTTRYLHCEQVEDMGGVFSLIKDSDQSLRVQNGTALNLHGSGVLRRLPDGELQGAWIGDLRAKSSVPLKFEPFADEKPHFRQWDESSATLSYAMQAVKLRGELDTDGDRFISRPEATRDPNVRERFALLDEHRDGRWDPELRDGRWDWQEILRYCRESRSGAASLGQLIELASEAMRLVPNEVRLIGWSDQDLPGVTIRPAAIQKTQYNLVLVHLQPGSLPEPKPDVEMWADVFDIKPQDEGAVSGENVPLQTAAPP